MLEISDFSNLNEIQKSALLKLFKQYPDQKVFSQGVWGDLTLKFRIIKHLSSSTLRFGKQGTRIRYEVLDNTHIFKNSQSTIYKSLFTLAVDMPNQLNVKKRKPGTLRLVKEQIVDATKPILLRHLNFESQYMQLSSFFHAKPLVRELDTSFIVMRELEGVNMFGLLQTVFTLNQTFNLSIALLKFMKEHIHDKNLVHRDIKAENILVHQIDDEFIVHIIDYGFIKPEDYDDSEEIVGTKFYAPPEYFLNNIITNNKYDIYLMGRVLLYLWGGYDSDERQNDFPSYETASTPELGHLFARMGDKPECQQEIKDIISAMCAQDRDKRPDVAHVLEQFIDLEPLLNPKKKLKISD